MRNPMRIRLPLIALMILSLASLHPAHATPRGLAPPAACALVITQGRIVDGTGNPWFEGDVAIKDGRIAEIGRIAAERGTRVIAAHGMIVAPGFIDVHTHIESGIEALPAAENFLRMGVTSVITGNCGGSALPLGEWFA